MTVVSVETLEELKQTWLRRINCIIFCLWPKLWCKHWFTNINVECPKKLFNLHKELPFLPERKKLEKVKKLVCGIEDRKNKLFT